MYEVLFKCLLVDKTAFVKGASATTKKTAGDRFAATAYVLRLAVEAGISSPGGLKTKTVKAVYNHVYDMLRTPEMARKMQPVVLDYVKALRTCLEGVAHVEHFSAVDWSTVVGFCVEHLRVMLGMPKENEPEKEKEVKEVEEEEEEEDETRSQAGTPKPRRPLQVRGRGTPTKRSASGTAPAKRLTHESEELLECLRHLLAAPNAPILPAAETAASVLLGFLKTQISVTRAHQTVFAAINHILNAVSTNNIALASKIAAAAIPVIAKLWDTKLPGLKEEMVVFLLQTRLQIRADIVEEKGKLLRKAVEDLLENITNDYISRADRDTLQLDDVVFPCPLWTNRRQRSVLSINAVALAPSLQDFRNEHHWAVLYIVAMFIEMLDQPTKAADKQPSERRRGEVEEDGDKSQQEPVKRMRIETLLDAFMRYIRSTNGSRKLLALQVMPFLADLGGVKEEVYGALLGDLYEACGDDVKDVAAWGLVAIGSLAFIPHATHSSHTPVWSQIFRLATRFATTHAKCRAACHLQRIILARKILPYASVAKEIDTILASIDLNGPALLADSSLSLWRLILELRSMTPQNSRIQPGMRVLEWFMSKWRPADGLERTGGTFYQHYKPHHVSATEIINFLLACCGAVRIKIEGNPQQFCGPIGQAFFRQGRLKELQELLLDSRGDEAPDAEDDGGDAVVGKLTRNYDVENLVLDCLEQQLELVHQKWQTISSASVQQVTESISRNLISFVLIMNIVGARMDGDDAKERAGTIINKMGLTLTDDVYTYIKHKDCTQKQLDGILLAVAEILPHPEKIIEATMADGEARKPVLALDGETGDLIARVIEEHEAKKEEASQQPEEPEDLMDIDDEFTSFRDNSDPMKKETPLAREYTHALCSEDAFRLSTMSMMKLCAILSSPDMDVVDRFTAFMEYCQQMPKNELIMMRPLVVEFLKFAAGGLDADAMVSFLQYVGEELLMGYTVERAETAIGFCVDAIGAVAPLWVPKPAEAGNTQVQKSQQSQQQPEGGLDQDIVDSCEQMYLHAVKVALTKKVASPYVRVALSRLLQRIISSNSSYCLKGEDPPIDLVLSLLNDSDVRVSFTVAKSLPEIFGLFPPGRWGKLSTQAESNMPQERDWREGLALRIYTSGQLAMVNKSNLTRMVFRIFETAQLPFGGAYARRALTLIATAAPGVETPKDLLRLFASKLLYIWTDHYQLMDFPFAAFGYGHLREMCWEVKDELVAQLIAKGQDDVVANFADYLSLTVEEVVEQGFARTIAYALAWRFGRPGKVRKPGTQDSVAASMESQQTQSPDVRIGKRLGNEKFVELERRHLREIIGIFFELLVVEPSCGRYLAAIAQAKEKRLAEVTQKDTPTPGASMRGRKRLTEDGAEDPHLIYAALEEILAYGSSATTSELTTPLHPHFKVRHIFAAINHLVEREDGVQNTTMWNPAMVTFVARRLFDYMHPAWGSAHANTVIANLRLLVAMAGGNAVGGYPLEMLVLGLRRFVMDPVCAMNAVGLLKYLVDRGRGYLEGRPTFILGVYLSMLAGLRNGKNKEVDAAATAGEEEGEGEEDVGRGEKVAREFHGWLAERLTSWTFSGLNTAKATLFWDIVQAAAEFGDHGNASIDTPESKLLSLLLEDDATSSSDRLLDDIARKAAFELCSSNFERPATFRQDVFGTDEDSVSRAKSLLRVCKGIDVNTGFLQWSARVLGRAYAATGHLHDEWTQEMEFRHSESYSLMDLRIVDIVPKAAIISRLRELLLSGDSTVVGEAERAFERIIYAETKHSRMDEQVFKIVLQPQKYAALQWHDAPPVEKAGRDGGVVVKTISACGRMEGVEASEWVKGLTVAMCRHSLNDPVISHLPAMLLRTPGLAEELFPYITHILLLQDARDRKGRGQKAEISALFGQCLAACTADTVAHCSLLIKCILYLRTQHTFEEIKHETLKSQRRTSQANAAAPGPTKLGREQWIDLDYRSAAEAAKTCQMFKTSLMFAEIHDTVPKTNVSSRSSIIVDLEAEENEKVPPELLLEIFRNVDDPDSYYGVNQAATLGTVLGKFEYEGNGWKSLSHRGANLESLVRLRADASSEAAGVVDALTTLGMNGLSHTLLNSGGGSDGSDAMAERMFKSAWKLEQWDLPCPETSNAPSAPIYKALQAVNTTVTGSSSVSGLVDPRFEEVMRGIVGGVKTGGELGVRMRTLAMLTEMEEVLTAKGEGGMKESWLRLVGRCGWMHTGRYSDVGELMAMRQAACGSLAKQEHLQKSSNVDMRIARLMEAKALIGACKMARSHKELQNALSAATQLSKVVESCRAVKADIAEMATLQAANVLWEEGQGIGAINMMRTLQGEERISSNEMAVGRAKLMAKLGTWLSEARILEPGQIMSEYLEKSIDSLKKNTGSDAGRVYHEFASFCDQQLQNPNNIEDFQRALKLRQQKEYEVQEFDRLIKETAPTKDQMKLQHYQVMKAKSQNWLFLDNQEFQRLKSIREAFLEKSISNYLLALMACDQYDSDAVRFAGLWLANAQDPKVNAAATRLNEVQSRKFVPLINQLSSRLLDSRDEFQNLLFRLVARICRDHPYHGMYQILALQKFKPKDAVSTSRQSAAIKVSEALRADKKSQHTLISLDLACTSYSRLAVAKVTKPKDGTIIQLRALLSKERYPRFEKDIPASRIPPPTMHIAVRTDCNYTHLPGIAKFINDISIASGISAPKIVKLLGTDGQQYKMLVKGGNDDLRQDAIMEQVFEQVSVLLQKNRITRQRSLKVRTYKVIPITATCGVIEFVANTIPLHDYLLPAHSAYYPKDWNPNQCRKQIAGVQQKSRETRVHEFQIVMERFRPVMRFFFMHEFNGPDEWYASRLAYTRSTAAISILGHVLGLGDRHGHNILLDKATGEVVHIDLGVAFEQGRILPVPEVVPFRLTRDIVDGMGITKTEGVFRRCCEFTLEVLRNEAYNITTILDVLRYDPLYSWTVSPIRMKRMQEHVGLETPGDLVTEKVMKRGGDGGGTAGETEADRALVVVGKKLSKTLSVGAAVNELIMQASDVKNLAVLYAGWAAYA